MTFKLKPIFIACMLSIMPVAYADTALFYAQPEDRETIEDNKFIQIKFDEKTYDLAFTSFLYNNNAKDAYALAKSAVHQNPDSIVWRKKLIQTAIWTAHPYVALDNLVYLIKEKNQADLFEQAITLAEKANQFAQLTDLLERELKAHPGNEKYILGLSEGYRQLGFTEKSIQLDLDSYNKYKKISFLEDLASTYWQLDDYENELKVLKQIEALDKLTPKTAMEMSTIYYEKANLRKALDILLQNQNKATSSDVEYWSAMARLAWVLNDDATAKLAFGKLYETGKLDRDGLRRYLLTQSDSASAFSAKLALSMWKQDPSTSTYLLALDYAHNANNQIALHELYNVKLSPADRRVVESQPGYWYNYANYLQSIAGPELARLLFLKAVLARPNDLNLHVAYFDFLLNQLGVDYKNQQPEYMLAAYERWHKNYAHDDAWINAYTTSLLLQDKSNQALEVFASHGAKAIKEDVNKANRYADILDGQLFLDKYAYDTRKENWFNIQKAIGRDNDLQFWRDYNQLSQYYNPAEIHYPLSSYLAENDPADLAADPLMSFAINHNNYELLAYLANYKYPHGMSTFGALRLAILQNDQIKMGEMLKSMRDMLPRKDRIQAARQIGELPLAQTMVFESAGNSRDSQRYDQLRETMLETASHVLVGEEFEQFGPLQGFRTYTKAKLFYDYKWSVSPYTSLWKGQTNNSGNLAPRSYIEKLAGVVFARQTDRSNLYIDMGTHQFLYSSLYASVAGNYLTTSKLTLGGRAGYNERSTLGTFMLIAGSQDELEVNATYNHTVRDSFSGSLQLQDYYLQNRERLGSGTILTGTYDHKLWLDYPDYTIQLTSSINRFRRINKEITDRSILMFPENVTPDTTSFIPNNFWNVGATFLFGGAIRDGYTHDWRPFASIGLIRDSISGIGQNMSLGYAGAVFGRDKLMFYYDRSTITSGTTQTNFTVGAMYQLFF